MKTFMRTAAFSLSAAALMLSVTPAHAATWVTTLNSSEAQSNGPWGTVTVTELNANTVEVALELKDDYRIVDTGAHHAFTFGLLDSPNSTITITSPNAPPREMVYLGEGSFANSPFGSFGNAFACCGRGARDARPEGPFTFTVSNSSGITFAGVGYTVDSGGRLTGLGSGNRFMSNAGGWWFAVDVVAPNGSTTGAVAGRDAFCQGCGGGTAIPEPSTWALMIVGFGGAGALIRRRRYTVA